MSNFLSLAMSADIVIVFSEAIVGCWARCGVLPRLKVCGLIEQGRKAENNAGMKSVGIAYTG
jgi:hypothetical protein